MWTSLSLSIGLGLSITGWLTVRAVARAWNFRPVAVLLDVAAPFLGFLIVTVATARPVYAGTVIFVSAGGFAFADSVKRTVLREPIVFTDLSEFFRLFRHPEFYLPYAGIGLVIGGAIVVACCDVALLLLEPTIFVWSPWLAILAVSLPIAAIWAIDAFFVGFCARLLRRLGPSGDPFDDASQFGPLAIQVIYGIIAKDERTWRRARVAPAPVKAKRSGAALPAIVLVQCESFFDARRAHPSIVADLLPTFDVCCRSGIQSGRLAVPCWGANTPRTEFSVLTGLSDEAINLDRFNPYHAFALRPVDSIAWRLRAKGYRTICIHPFDRHYYDRDRIMTNLGFDLFLGEEAFASGCIAGSYISDLAVAQLGNQLLREHRAGGIFLFAITIGNHGPWGNAKPSTMNRELAPALPSSSDAHALRRFLRGLQESDTMLKAFCQSLALDGKPGLLSFYGDHQPSFPKLFSEIGYTDMQTDYCLWQTTSAKRPKRRDIASHDLAHVILDALAVTAPDAIAI